MKVTQEKLPASQVGLEIEITPEMSKKAYEKVIQDFTRSLNVPGFRKGKVPRQVLIQRIGADRIKASAVEELVDDSLKAAIKQEKIDALGNFQLRSSFEDLVSQFQPGQTLTFSASVDVPPTSTLSEYKGMAVQAEEIKADLSRVDQVLSDYQEQIATLVPVEGRPAQIKDVAVVDFKGVLPSADPDGEPEEIPGAEANDFQVELDEGKFIPGFVDGIVGMSPGDTKEVAAVFPETYPQSNVAGKTANFTVTLKELKEKELPELDDDFAQEASDDEFQTLAEWRESLETRFNEEAESKTRSNKEEAILNELLNHIEVEIPETLVEREVNFMINQTAMQLQNQGVDVRQLFTQEMVAQLQQQSRSEALKRIKRTLALGEVAKQEAIAVQEEELSAKIAELMTQLGDQAQDIDPERIKSVVSEDLLKEKIVDWLLENSAIELVPEGTLAKEDPEIEELEFADETTEASVEGDAAIEVSAVEISSAESESPDSEAIERATTEPETALSAQEDLEPAPKKKRSPKTAKAEEPISESSTEPATTEESVSKARKATKKTKTAE
jgi:trigger factor